jgi:hypothetical protein
MMLQYLHYYGAREEGASLTREAGVEFGSWALIRQQDIDFRIAY